MTEPMMMQARGDGIDIRLAVWKGRTNPVFAVHGLTANCRCWDTIAGALAPEIEVVAMDLRGRGNSAKPPYGYSVDAHCGDIMSVLEELDLKPVLMGHSLGALIVLAFAAKYPQAVDRVVLIDGAGTLSEDQTRRVFDGIRPALERLDAVSPSVEHYLDRMKKAPFLQPWSAALDTYFRYELEMVPSGVRSRVQLANIIEEIDNLKQFDTAALYGRVHCPVLILRATDGLLTDEDLVLPEDAARRMEAEIQNAACASIEGTNHYTIIFHPHPVRDRILRDFITRPHPGLERGASAPQ